MIITFNLPTKWYYINIIKKTIILKLGGSIVTQKNREGVFIRRKLLSQIAVELVKVLKVDKNIRLIIIHGAGAAGHQLANKYGLKSGVNGDTKKLHGSLLTRIACQNLDLTITNIFVQNGLPVTPVHTASSVIQNNKIIESISYEIIDQVFASDCVPMMYGEMTFDKTLGMSVCSGDAIAMKLAKKYDATKIIFASDIDGIYDKDPHTNKDALLITSTTLKSISSNKDITLSESHNVDVTGGLANKIAELIAGDLPKSLRKVIVCNGLKPNILSAAFTDQEKGTVINI